MTAPGYRRPLATEPIRVIIEVQLAVTAELQDTRDGTDVLGGGRPRAVTIELQLRRREVHEAFVDHVGITINMVLRVGRGRGIAIHEHAGIGSGRVEYSAAGPVPHRTDRDP